MKHAFRTLLVVCMALLLPLAARAAPAGERQQWGETAREAEALLQHPREDDAYFRSLETVRDRLARQRDRAFRIGQNPSIALKVLSAELEALGPRPKGDAAEVSWQAQRRADLESRIGLARLPQQTANEDYFRAQVLITELDHRINAHVRGKLLLRAPSPLWPGGWIALPGELRSAWGDAQRTLASLHDAQGRRTLASAWPLAVLLAVVGMVIAVGVQRPMVRRLDDAVDSARSRGGAILLLFIRDLATIIVPVTGLLVILVAVALLLRDTRLLKPTADIVVAGGVLQIFAVWLGRSVFSPSSDAQRWIPMTAANAWTAFRLTGGLGTIFIFEMLVEYAGNGSTFSSGVNAVLAFIVIIATAIMLWWLAAVVRRDAPMFPAGDDAHGIDFRYYAARAMQLIAVSSVLLAAAGYVEMSRSALIPATLTLAVIALGVLTFRRLMLISGAVVSAQYRHTQTVRLFPVLYGFAISLCCLPLIAVLWGVRAAEIADFVALLRNGFAVGDVRISAGDVLVFALVFVIGYGMTRWIQRLLQISLFPVLQLDAGVQAALTTGIGYAGLTLSALIAITSAGLDLSSLALVAGALSVGVGLGLQSVVANFVSGVILLVERPIKEGDWIEVGGHAGTVAKISVRSTRLRTADQDDVIIPNSDLIASAVRNRTYGGKTGRVGLEVGVAYGTDLAKATEVIRQVAADCPDVVQDVPVNVVLEGFGDSAVQLKLLCLVNDISMAPLITSQLRFDIYARFQQAGIAIPFPQREVTLRRRTPGGGDAAG